MDFKGFDPKKINECIVQSKALYSKTYTYKEFEQKSARRTIWVRK